MGSERRNHPRTPIELKVEYKKVNTFFYDYTRNISKGGTFIKTARPLPVGTEFVFMLVVPHLDEPLRLNGLVKWVVSERDAEQAEDEEPGMGIEFVYADVEEREHVEGIVEGLMVQQLGERAHAKLMGKD